jgi:hypothetical protein
VSLIVVSGALANKAGNGGAAWTRLSWVLGLARLGHDVYFVEQLAPDACTDARGARCDVDRSVNLAYFRDVTTRFGLGDRAALVPEAGFASAGLPWSRLVEIATAADLLVNISGHLTLPALKHRFRTRAFIDLDPGYTQHWHLTGLAEEKLEGHHCYFTVGENIGRPGCTIPADGIPWQPVRQPVLLDEWPVAEHTEPARFTTVSSWRGPYGRISVNGVPAGLKAHEFRKFVSLPALTRHRFEIALDVHPADHADVELMQGHRWTIVEPRRVAGDPVAFRDYVRRSGAEFSVAQGIYVATGSGWFSDRTVRYLASGKPALVQDTGFGRNYPVGHGLLSFRSLEEAAAGAESIAQDYAAHSRAARALAEAFFDSDKVLSDLLARIGGMT